MSNNKTRIIAEPGKQELYIIREFEAPRETVFRAFITPELLLHWLGAGRGSMRIEHMDYRVGGSYRYYLLDPQANSYAFYGVVHEVTAPERIIQTFEFEGLPERGHVSLETILFETLPGDRTKVTIQSVSRSVADRDGKIGQNMEECVMASHKWLDAVLEREIKSEKLIN